MFWMIAGIAAFLWLLGLVIGCARGGAHSPPLVVAFAMVLIAVVEG